MKIRDGYQKITLAGATYLMPYGQNAADRAHSLKLNTTSEFLWDALVSGADEEQLISIAAKEFEATEEDLPILREDIRHFVSALAANGILQLSDHPQPHSGYEPSYYQIGPMTFAYYGPIELYDRYFKKFACGPTSHTDQSIFLKIGMPRYKESGTILLRTNELQLCDAGFLYRFLFQRSWGIYEMTLTKDGSCATAYCTPDAFDDEHIEQVFHALRFAFLLLAQKYHLYALHSASFLYQGKAWLFSGPSGTGKSTHTNLWHELYDVPLFNGDLNVIGIRDNIPMVYGLPWCGTSGINTIGEYPLGGIVFLKQAPENHVIIPDEPEKAFMLMQRLISPIWDAEQLEEQAAFCEAMAAIAPILSLHCTKENEAAETMKRAIDQL